MSATRILSGYEPASVLSFFEDICAIPHVSGDEKAIADYVEAFAKTRGLTCYRDAVHNVFIKLPASAGHESAPAVMLQGHTDMVGEKTADSTHDFATDGLKLKVDANGWISATDTTLGGDNGIAVAMMLAILDNPPQPHPAIECLFTVSEETGLEGAWAFDPVAAEATARTMINLDSEAEGVITAGCSGGMRTDITVPVTCEPAEGVAVKITLDGFTGGHSGVEIHEGHTNAIKAMGRIWTAAGRKFAGKARLCSMTGGGKDNAIPRDCTALFSVSDEWGGNDPVVVEAFCRMVRAEADLLRKEPNVIPADKTFTCTVEIIPAPAYTLTVESDLKIHDLLSLVRDGVLSMSAHVKGLVAHSRNLGIVKTITDGEGKPTAVKFSMSTRSASNTHLDDSEAELCALAAVITGDERNATHRARYPGWDYAPTSPLRDLWTAVSERLYGITPRVEVIHAGLECGILCDKLGEMDIISVGPDMKDIHTPREMLLIPSVERTYRLVCETLRELA